MTMPSMDDWVNEQLITFYDPVPDDHLLFEDDSRTSRRHPLDRALDKVALAVAALQRAGSRYLELSEHFWAFASGSWSRHFYDAQVGAASCGLPDRVSVLDDVVFAENKIAEAMMLLRREGDARDARDLGDALESYRREGAGQR